MSSDAFAIPVFGAITQCPMCKVSVSEFGVINYHPQVAGYATPEVTCRNLITELIREQVPLPQGHDVWETFLGEHLCRKCRRCGYGWVEHPRESQSVYTPTEDKEDHDAADDSPEAG